MAGQLLLGFSSSCSDLVKVTIAVSSVLSACKLEEEEKEEPCRAFLDLCRLRWQELYPIRSVADLVAVGEVPYLSPSWLLTLLPGTSSPLRFSAGSPG